MKMESINKYSYMQTDAVALAAVQITTRAGNLYRAFVGWSDVNNPNFPPALVWTAFKAKGTTFDRLPCFTDAEERAFPKSVARAAHELWLAVDAQLAPPACAPALQPTLF